MRQHLVGFRMAISCLAIAVVAGVGQAGAEKTVAMKDLPSAVRAAAEKLTAGGTLKRIVREKEDGVEAYSVEATVSGKDKEFTFAPDGTLLAEEEEIAIAQLPDPVRAAAEKYFGATQGLHASKEVAKGVTSFEVEGKKTGKAMSLKLDETGTLLEEEKEED